MEHSLTALSADALIRYAKYTILLLIVILMITGSVHYTGQLHVYIAFTIVANTLLFMGFRKNAIFFDTFIGLFFWLGFWLKLTVRVCFSNGAFHEAVGDFDGSGAAFDHALWVSTIGMSGLIVASLMRERLFFSFPERSAYAQNGIITFYQAYRRYVLIGFVGLFMVVALSNLYLGIYQRGEITQTTLPFGLNGVFKWLLLFGLTSISAVILRCELVLNNHVSYFVVALCLLESFFSNVSLLSRGMILNISALAIGLYVSMKRIPAAISLRFLMIAAVIFAPLFVSSVLVVNHIRTSHYHGFNQFLNEVNVNEVSGEAKNMASPLFLDRWVGIEGVMAVSSNPKIGWNLWNDAWRERYSESAMSFYDKNLIASPYNQTDFTKYHHISLPGILAFFYYPGSLLFLFVSMLMLGLLAALVEFATFKLGGENLILCGLIGEVVAYRFANFGYVPAQSYLLFGTILMSLFIIYYLNKWFNIRNARKQGAH